MPPATTDLTPRDAATCATSSPRRRRAARPLEIVGGATKRGLGRPVDGATLLSTAALGGATIYEPDELS